MADEAQQNWPKVRAILMKEWDPIGVCDAPQAQDEYDSYVGRISMMLADGQVTREVLAAHLFNIATEHMGLAKTPWLSERCDQATTALIALRPKFEAC